MNLRATAVLLLIAFGLGLWVWFGETGGGAGDPAARKLVPVEIEEVTALELPLKDGGRVRLVRAGEGAWVIEFPVAHPAAEEQVADLLRRLTGLETRARLDDVGEDRTPFGLDEASAAVRVEAGDRAHVLRLGRETPFGGDQYVSIEGDEAVYTVASWKLSQLQRDLLALRDARMFELAADDVDRLRIEIAGKPLAAAQRMDGEWVLTEPFAEPGDQDTITRLLEDLDLARAVGFVDAPGPLSDYGLEAPQVVLELGAGEERGERIEMGGNADTRYLRVGGTGQIYEIAARIADGVPRSVFALRDKQVLKVEEGRIDRVKLVFPRDDLRFSFMRGEAGWTTEADDESSGAPLDAPLDEVRLEDLVYTLSDLAAVEIPPADARPGPLGLEPARVRVELGDADGNELGWIELGDPEPGTGIGARSSQKERLWIVDETLGAEVPLGIEAFRNRWLRSEDRE